jgi:hypothetical protein
MKWLRKLLGLDKQVKFVYSKALVYKIPNYGILKLDDDVTCEELHAFADGLRGMLKDSGKSVVVVNKNIQVFDFKKVKKK